MDDEGGEQSRAPKESCAPPTQLKIAVAPRKARPKIYGLEDLLWGLSELRLPNYVHNVLHWRSPLLSSVHLLLGLWLLHFLVDHSALKLLTLLAVALVANIVIYAVLRSFVRFRPFEALLKAELSVSPQLILSWIKGLVHCFNRTLATLQFVLFGGNLAASCICWLLLVELYCLDPCLDTLTLASIAYVGAFILPKLLHLIRRRLYCALFDSPLSGLLAYLVELWDMWELVPPPQQVALQRQALRIGEAI